MVATLSEHGPQPGTILANGSIYKIRRGFFNRRFIREMKAYLAAHMRKEARQVLGEIPATSQNPGDQEIRQHAISVGVNTSVSFTQIMEGVQDPDHLPFVLSQVCDIKMDEAEAVADDCNILETIKTIAECIGMDELKNSSPPTSTGEPTNTPT